MKAKEVVVQCCYPTDAILDAIFFLSLIISNLPVSIDRMSIEFSSHLPRGAKRLELDLLNPAQQSRDWKELDRAIVERHERGYLKALRIGPALHERVWPFTRLLSPSVKETELAHVRASLPRSMQGGIIVV